MPPRGAVVVLELPSDFFDARTGRTRVRSEIRNLHLTSDASVVLRTRGSPEPVAFTRTLSLARAGATAVVPSECRGAEVAAVLRARHAGRFSLSTEWVRWLALRRTGPRPWESEVRVLAREAHRHGEVGEVLRSAGLAPRTVRAHFRKAGLPSPSKWHVGGRLLRAQSWLISNSDLRAGAVARKLGYSDAHSMSNVMHRIWHVTAPGSRHLLGFGWRFAAWLEWAQRP